MMAPAMVDNTLAKVKRAAAAKRRADENYRAALLEAHAAGDSFAAIADAAKTSRQRVRQFLGRQKPDPPR
jgi:hypothetical protein